MDWVTVAGLAFQYGLPFAEKLINKWETKTPVSSAEWADLKSVAQNTALSQMKAALARAGIPETDPKAIALLAQVPQ